ncbi:MAG: enoyl-CoA hydratase/isomerase family protein [Gemmatimonadetes bacterium]|nr:enoyl-CoA hydratase/isomerase family protein [Gemmatimonadota bacterium]
MAATPEFEFLSVRQDEAVLHVRLARPERLNAFADTVRDDLRRVIERADGDPEIGCLVVSGEGRAFCAGGDVDVMHDIRRDDDLAAFAAILDAANRAALALRRCRVPTIALVHGAAAGGGANLALGCDVRWGSETASFTQSFIHLGLAPDWGGSRLLVEVVGLDRARELLLTGRTVRADEARTLGLLHRVIEGDALLEKGLDLARTLAGRSPTALQALGALLASAASGASFEDQLALERREQLACFDSAEARAAFEAFLARRKR